MDEDKSIKASYDMRDTSHAKTEHMSSPQNSYPHFHSDVKKAEWGTAGLMKGK